MRTIRGEVTSDARPSRARNVLIGVQVTASALLLICSAVFLRSALAASTADPGIRTADTVIDRNRQRAVPRRDGPGGQLRNRPSPQWRPRGRTSWAGRAGFATTADAPVPIDTSPIGSCRPNTSACSASTSCEAAASRPQNAPQTRRSRSCPTASRGSCGRNATRWVRCCTSSRIPIRKRERVDEPPLPARTFTVVGVVRDVRRFPVSRIFTRRRASMCRPAPRWPKTSLTVRVQGDPEQARRALLQRSTTIDPNMGAGHDA